MPGTMSCPHCGKSLKLLDDVLGKTIRCPGCQQTFKASSPAPAEVTTAVLPAVTPADEGKEALAREARASVGGPPSIKKSSGGNGLALGVVLGALGLVLVLCGGFGTFVFFVGRAWVHSVQYTPPTDPVVNGPPPPQPNPNPQPKPNPNPNPQPNPQPQPNPNPVPPPAKEQLKRDGDRLKVHARGTRMVRTLPDGKMLAAVGEDGTVTLLELPTFRGDPMAYGVHRTFPIDRKPFRGLAFHPSSQMAVVAGDRLEIYNTFMKKVNASVACNEPVAAVFIPSGTALVFAVQKPDGKGSELRVWDTWRHVESVKPLPLPGKVTHLDHSIFPTYHLAAVEDDKVHLYHLSAPHHDFHRIATIATKQGSLRGMAFNPRSQDVVTVGGDGTVKCWAAKDGKFLRSYEGATNPSGRPAFTPDGSRLAVLDGDKVRLWHTAGGAIQSTLDLAPEQGGNIDFLRDNNTLVIALRNVPIRFWAIPDAKEPVRPGRPPVTEPVRPGRPPVTELVPPAPTRFGKAERPEEANRFDVGIAIDAVGFSPDGKTLAASDCGGQLLLLNVADWTRRAVKGSAEGPRGRRGRGAAVTFAYGGDGRLVCAGGGGGSARVYLRDGASGELRGDFPVGDGWVRCLAVSPDGKRLAVGLESRSPLRPGDQPRDNDTAFVRLWDISGQPKQLGTLEKLSYPLGGLAFDRDGRTLHVAAGNLVRRWQTETREELPALEGALADLAAVVVAPDGRVYAAGDDLMIHSWDAEGRHAVPWEGHRLAMNLGNGRDGGVTGLALTADRKRLASVACDRTCRLWDTATGETVAVTEDKSQGGHVAVGLLAFSPDGKLLLVAADYSKVSVLQTDRVKGKAPVPPPPAKKESSEAGEALTLAAVPGSSFFLAGFGGDATLLTANPSGGLQRWAWPDGELREEKPHFRTVEFIASSRDGKVVAVGTGNAVYLRDGASGKLLGCLPPPPGEKYYNAQVSAVALSPQGDLLALARHRRVNGKNSYDLIVWDVKQGRPRAVAHPTSSLGSLAFSPDGKTLAAGLTSDNCVALYGAEDLQEPKLIAKQKRWVQALAFSPDGKRLATSSNDGLVRMWNVAEGKELWSKPWSHPNAWKQSIVFSPDGKWLVAAPLSQKQGLVLVDADNGNLRIEVTRRPMPNSVPSFSPDGKFLAVVRKAPDQVVVYDVAQLLARMP